MTEFNLEDSVNQLNEYKQNLLQTILQDHEESPLAHYNQVVQMLNHLCMLSEDLATHSAEQEIQISELQDIKTEFMQKNLDSESVIRTLEEEIKNMEQQINRLEQNCSEFENQLGTKNTDLKEANDSINKFIKMNKDLSQQISDLEAKQKIKIETRAMEDIDAQEKSQQRIIELETYVAQMEQQEKECVKVIEDLSQENQMWEQKTQELYVTLQQNEIVQEKAEYERKCQIKEQYRNIRTLQDQIAILEARLHQSEAEKNVLMSKRVMAQESFTGSFLQGKNNGQSFVTQVEQHNEMLRRKKQAVSSESGTTGNMEIKEDDNEDAEEAYEQVMVQEEDDESPTKGAGDFQEVQQLHIQPPSFLSQNEPGSFIESQQFYTVNAQYLDGDEPTAFRTGDEPEDEDIKVELQSPLPNSRPAVKTSPVPLNENPLNFLRNAQTKDDIESRRDPEEEFFKLSVLALKMIHTEEYQANDYIYEISSERLFQQVKQLNIPFHKWYQWLETRFSQLQESQKAEETIVELQPLTAAPEETKTEQPSYLSAAQQNAFGIFDRIYKMVKPVEEKVENQSLIDEAKARVQREKQLLIKSRQGTEDLVSKYRRALPQDIFSQKK